MTEFAPRPKKKLISRLLAHLTAIGAGVFYIIHPPITTTTYLDAIWPARTWGVFFVVGGLIATYAWYQRVLLIKKIGLTLEITALFALLVAQLLVMLDEGVTWTRGGGVMALLFGFFLLMAYWQDITHSEEEAERAEEAKRNFSVYRINQHPDEG